LLVWKRRGNLFAAQWVICVEYTWWRVIAASIGQAMNNILHKNDSLTVCMGVSYRRKKQIPNTLYAVASLFMGGIRWLILAILLSAHGMLLVPVRNHHTTQYSNDIFTDCLCTIKITITYRKMDAFNIWQCWDTGYPPHLYICITIKCRNSAKYDYFSIAAILGKPLWIYVCFWLSCDVLLLYMWIEFVGNLQELVGKLMILLHQYLLACWLWFLYVICPILR